MKTQVRNYLLVIFTVMPFLFVSCEDSFLSSINGEGEIVQETLSIDYFDGFVSAISADVYVSQGDDFEIVVEAQRNIIENLNTDQVRDGIWTIKYHQMVRNSKKVKIYITLPDLTRIGLSGSGEIVGETPFLDLDKIDLSISGSGSIDLDSESQQMDIRISGSGDMFLIGNTNILDCTISGSGSINAYEMETIDADIHVSGSGDTRLDVDESLTVSISGSGSVFYRGNPHVDSHISGSGQVKRDR